MGFEDRSVLWADCLATTAFEPDPVVKAGPKWLRIRWPNQSPTNKFFNSGTSDPFRGYAYVGYTIPYGHNGRILACG